MVKQESDSGELLTEDSNSPASPPLKRLRTTPILPHLTSSFTNNDQQQQDWRSRSTDHPPSHAYTQVWANGWINTSYPIGITQLEHQSDASYDDPESYGPRDCSSESTLGVLMAARTLSTQQRRVLHHKQSFNVDYDYSAPGQLARYVDSIQRVPDVTTVPELSPSGYVLTPAPTPPDMKDVKTTFFAVERCPVTEVFSEQCVPVSEAPGFSSNSSGNTFVMNGQDLATNTTRGRLFAPSIHANATNNVDVNCERNPNNPTPPMEYQPSHHQPGW